MSIRIDSDIPKPAAQASQAQYPFDKLEVGQSFFLPRKSTSQLGPAIARARQRLNRAFSIRTVAEEIEETIDGEPKKHTVRGVRIWRDS